MKRRKTEKKVEQKIPLPGGGDDKRTFHSFARFPVTSNGKAIDHCVLAHRDPILGRLLGQSTLAPAPYKKMM